MSGRPVSGLQRQVLRLYRDALRVARSKPSEQRTSLEAHIRAELDKNRGVKKTDFRTIEYLLRQANKQLDLFRLSQTESVGYKFSNVPTE
mmetsp:Transcript_3590/g.8570  ORF Transcript_3590/g.8570 Transcript_3590/m.8570 type:complete len:90 (+) Transcript_3590:199-468(+)